MIQLQYYNSILKKNHINQILDNYKLKYSLVVKEIESKVNKMMKLFLEDILIFLENIEEVADQKQKINEYDKNKRELDMMRIKLENKAYNENKLKNDIDLLLQENNILKLKVNSLNNKIFNLNKYYFYNSQYSSPLRKTFNKSGKSKYSNSVSRRNNPSISPKNTRQNNLFIVLNNTSISEENINSKHSYSLMSPKRHKKKLNKKDKSSQDNEHKNENKANTKKNKDTKKNKKRNNADKYVKFLNNKSTNNYKNINANEDNNLAKSYDKNNNSCHSPLNNNKINFTRNDKNLSNTIKTHKSSDLESNSINNRYSPLNSLNTFNQSMDLPYSNLNLDYDDIGKKINEVIDSELKELEQDEENLELLLGQLIDETENENDNNN